jgi:hypothetical protein
MKNTQQQKQHKDIYYKISIFMNIADTPQRQTPFQDPKCNFCNQEPGIYICIDCNICENSWCNTCLYHDVHMKGAKFKGHRIPFLKTPPTLLKHCPE